MQCNGIVIPFIDALSQEALRRDVSILAFINGPNIHVHLDPFVGSARKGIEVALCLYCLLIQKFEDWVIEALNLTCGNSVSIEGIRLIGYVTETHADGLCEHNCSTGF